MLEYIIEVIKAIFLGVVEGITEWLPISSTGHMILVDEFIKLNVSEEFKDKVQDSLILSDVMGSDHCPVELLLEV